jgi:DNA-binding transcriptional regulator YiaG
MLADTRQTDRQTHTHTHTHTHTQMGCSSSVFEKKERKTTRTSEKCVTLIPDALVCIQGTKIKHIREKEYLSGR